MIVEDKILEYLDGSLGEHESAELLETLAVSPEKRALLEEHLRLKDILALGRKPYSVPLATERALAERLPILSRPSIAPVPIGFRSALLGIRQWAGSRAAQTAMGVATMLAISAVSWFAMQPASQQLPIVGKQSFSSNFSSNKAKDIQDTRDANDAHSAITNSAATNYASTASAATHSAIISSASTHSAIISSASTQSAAIPSASLPSATIPAGSNDDQAIHPVANFPQNDVVIPREGGQSHTLNEVERGDIQSLRSVTIGAYFTDEKSYLPQSTAFTSTSPVGGQFAVTLDCGISDNFEIGIEAGQEVYAALNSGNGVVTGSVGSNYSSDNYSSSIAATQTYYFCLTTHYTISPESGFPFRLGLGGGIASTGEPTALATAGISRVLSEKWLLDLDVVFGGVWGQASQHDIAPPGGVVGITRQDVTQQTTFTSGAGIRAGLRFKL